VLLDQVADRPFTGLEDLVLGLAHQLLEEDLLHIGIDR
jgi:hypothetical protein